MSSDSERRGQTDKGRGCKAGKAGWFWDSEKVDGTVLGEEQGIAYRGKAK
jgi:hypothetical protein